MLKKNKKNKTTEVDKLICDIRVTWSFIYFAQNFCKNKSYVVNHLLHKIVVVAFTAFTVMANSFTVNALAITVNALATDTIGFEHDFPLRIKRLQ